MIRDFTCTVKRLDQFKIDVCNLIHPTFNLTYLSVPSHFISGRTKRAKVDRNEIQLPEGISVIGGELGKLELVQRRAES